MAIRVGDVVAQSSGLSNLGVEKKQGSDQGAFDITTLSPFNHIHFVSGIVHESQGGTSGVIRFNQHDDQSLAVGLPLDLRVRGIQPAIELSVDGGKTFPLQLGGTILPTAKPGATIRTPFDTELYLHASGEAKIVGEENVFMHAIGGSWAATSKALASIIGATSVNIDGNQNVRLRGLGDPPVPGKGTGGQIQLQAFNSSGQLEYRFGPHQSWYMKQTHSSISGPFGDGFNPLVPSGQIVQMILEQGGGSVPSGIDVISLTDNTVGEQSINGSTTNNLITWDTNLLNVGTALSHSITTNSSRVNINEDGFYDIYALLSYTTLSTRYTAVVKIRKNGSTVLSGRGKQGYVRAQTSNHEQASSDLAVIAELSSGDYLEVLVDRHNGDSSTVFLDNGEAIFSVKKLTAVAGGGGSNGGGGGIETLQEAYNGGRTIFIDNGNLEFTSATNKFRLASNGSQSTINMSGLLTQTTANHQLGDLNVIGHGQILTNQTVTSQAQVAARSLGPAVLSLNTGSGIINVSVGSGVARFRNTGGVQSTIAGGVGQPMVFDTVDIFDRRYAWDSSVTGVRFFVPGFYHVRVKASIQGGALSTVIIRLNKNGGGEINGGTAAAIMVLSEFATPIADVYVNMRARDYIQATGGHTGGASHTLRSGSQGSVMDIRYIGPRRTGIV